MSKPPKDDEVPIGKLTRREKQLLKRMDQDDKHDSRMARRDAATKRAQKKAADRKAKKEARKETPKKRKGK
jgi:hypothetical protein